MNYRGGLHPPFFWSKYKNTDADHLIDYNINANKEHEICLDPQSTSAKDT